MASGGTGDADLLVVGAGMVGVAVAAIAKKANPSARVTILDRSLAGTGASLYGGAIRVPFGITATHRKLARRSEELFAELAAWAGPMPDRRLPVVWILAPARQTEFVGWLTSGVTRTATAAERDALHGTVPDLRLSSDDIVLMDDAWCGNPGRTVAHLLACLRRQPGVECCEGVHVTAIEDRADGCDIVAADGQAFRARHVVRATGPWLELHRRRLGDSALRIKKVAALHVDVAVATDAPIVFFADDDAYLLPDPEHGRWIFCFASQEWDVEPEISRLMLTAQDRAIAARTLRRYAPALLDRCRGGRVFCDGYSATRVPAVARDPQSPRSVHALACSGSGYRLAPAIAETALGLLGDTLS